MDFNAHRKFEFLRDKICFLKNYMFYVFDVIIMINKFLSQSSIMKLPFPYSKPNFLAQKPFLIFPMSTLYDIMLLD